MATAGHEDSYDREVHRGSQTVCVILFELRNLREEMINYVLLIKIASHLVPDLHSQIVRNASSLKNKDHE